MCLETRLNIIMLSKNGDDNEMGNYGLVTITDPDVQVTLPILKYGYRTTKASWEELVRIIDVENNIFKLSRSPAQQHDYEVFRYHLKQQYRSVLDYILISKFGFDAVAVNEDNNNNNNNQIHQQRLMANPCLEDVPNSPKQIILVENDFPYCVEEHIVHYVLWKLKEAITPQEISEARKRLQSDPIRALEILQWNNPPSVKSIPEIDHVHFLCLLQPKEKSKYEKTPEGRSASATNYLTTSENTAKTKY